MVGDEIVTVHPHTYKKSITKVINQYVKHTDKDIGVLKTESGRSLTCTFDHPVLTTNGWKMASEAKNIAIIHSIAECRKENVLLNEYLKYRSQNSFGSPYLEWCSTVVYTDGVLFLPVSYTHKSKGGDIADITTESENHSFIAGDGFCVHNSNMGKQALGIPMLSYRQRADTLLYILHSPQRPLVSTKISDMLKYNEMPSGNTAIVAILTYTGL